MEEDKVTAEARTPWLFLLAVGLIAGLAYLTYPKNAVANVSDNLDYMRRQTEALESIAQSLDRIAHAH